MRDFYKIWIKEINNVVNLNLKRKHYASIRHLSKIVYSSIKYSSIMVNSSIKYSCFIMIDRIYELLLCKNFIKDFLFIYKEKIVWMIIYKDKID